MCRMKAFQPRLHLLARCRPESTGTSREQSYAGFASWRTSSVNDRSDATVPHHPRNPKPPGPFSVVYILSCERQNRKCFTAKNGTGTIVAPKSLQSLTLRVSYTTS